MREQSLHKVCLITMEYLIAPYLNGSLQQHTLLCWFLNALAKNDRADRKKTHEVNYNHLRLKEVVPKQRSFVVTAIIDLPRCIAIRIIRVVGLDVISQWRKSILGY